MGDPDSKVTLTTCDENGVKEISIVSEKANVTHDSYRIHNDSRVEVPQVINFNDDVKEPLDDGDDDEGWTDVGMDYSDDDKSDFDLPVFFDAKKNAITVKRVNEHCCRPSRAQCTKKQTREGNRVTEVTECNVRLGRTLCDSQDGGKRGINTCSALIKYARAQAAKQKQTRQEEETTTTTTTKTTTTTTEKPVTESEEDSDSEEYSDEEEDSEDQYDEVENKSVSKEEKGDSYVKSKTVKELSKSELEKVVKEITLPPSKGKPNPKCKKKKSRFRSAIFISTGCSKRPCRQKEPIPQTKTYTHRTAEIGVYIDKA